MRWTMRGLGVSKVVSLACLVTAVAAVITVACRDAGTSPERRSSRAVAARTSDGVSPAELHARNPMDWVGRAHSAVLDVVRREMEKPNSRSDNLCAAVSAWIDHPQGLIAVAPQVKAKYRPFLHRTLAESRLCNVRKIAKTGATPLRPASYWAAQNEVPGSAAEAAVVQVQDAVEAASDPTDLASRLSPIFDASLSMSELDATYVQTTISVGQSSYEYWYDGSALNGMYSSEKSELDRCYAGTYEGMTFEADGVTYLCHNSRWIGQVRYRRGPRGEAPLQLVALTTNMKCSWIYGASWGSAGRAVERWDANGATAGFLAGLLATANIGTAAAGAIVAGGVFSAATALAYVHTFYECNL